MPSQSRVARRWRIHGRVQGVGFRYFAQKSAQSLGLTGYACNLEDGGVEVYAVGAEERLSEFAGMLRRGPAWADVRGVEERPTGVQQYESFFIH